MKKIGNTDSNMVESASSRILSVVVARAGSKRLPNKHLLRIHGKCIFEYTIEYSLELEKKFNLHTIVSTDCKEIIQYCNSNKIDYLNRKEELTKDGTRIEDVLYDVCKTDKNYEFISLLYGNIPTRYAGEFEKAINFLVTHKSYDCVLSMSRIRHGHPSIIYELNNDILPQLHTNIYRGQDMKKYMVHDGHTILFRTDYFIEFMKKRNIYDILYEPFGKLIKPMLHENIIVDIDEKIDYELAKKVL